MCPKAWSINSPCDAHRCYFYPCVFLVLLYVLQVINGKRKKNADSIRECAQLLLRERSCPGGLGCMDPAAVLHWKCSRGSSQGEKRWREKGIMQRIQCSAVDDSKDQGYHALEVTQCVSGRVERGEKTCSLLYVQSLSFPALMVLLEGHDTDCACALVLHWWYSLGVLETGDLICLVL